MGSCLLFLGLYQAAILRSRDLQMGISSQLPTPRDLLKTALVDKSWVGVQKVFKMFTFTDGIILFENKQTEEIILETKLKTYRSLQDLLRKRKRKSYMYIELFS